MQRDRLLILKSTELTVVNNVWATIYNLTEKGHIQRISKDYYYLLSFVLAYVNL